MARAIVDNDGPPWDTSRQDEPLCPNAPENNTQLRQKDVDENEPRT